MKKVYIYWKFYEHSSDGVDYCVYDEKMHEEIQKAEHDAWDYLTFCGEAEIEPANRETVNKKACKVLDKKNADLQAEINRNDEKKRQLLAIDFQPQ